MWDLLITLGSIAFIPALLPTIVNQRAYIPRITSVLAVFGLLVVIIGLAGSGLVISAAVSSASAVLWTFILFFRGKTIDP